MQIVDPTFGLVVAEDSESDTCARTASSSNALCVLSNNKPNAAPLMKAVAQHLESARGLAPSGFLTKVDSARPAPRTLLAEAGERYRFALVGLGD